MQARRMQVKQMDNDITKKLHRGLRDIRAAMVPLGKITCTVSMLTGTSHSCSVCSSVTPQFTHQHSWSTKGRNDHFFPASLMQQATAFALDTFLWHMEQIWLMKAWQLIFSWWCLEPQASAAYEAGQYTVNICSRNQHSLWWKEIKSTESSCKTDFDQLLCDTGYKWSASRCH